MNSRSSNGNTAGSAGGEAIGGERRSRELAIELGLKPEGASEKVFLSPRVVDRRAFGELSGELRGLIDRASDERAVLMQTLEHARHSAMTIKESEAAQQGNLALSAKALKGLDERITRAQRLLEQATEVAGRTDELARKCDEIIAGKIAALESRLESAQAAAAARVEALEQRLIGSTREFEQRVEAVRRDADTVITPNISALNESCSRAMAIIGREPGGGESPGSMADLVRRGEAIKQSAEGSLRRLEEVQTIASTSRNAMTGLLDELSSVLGRADAQRETMAVEADRVREACKQAGFSIDNKMVEAERIAKLLDASAAAVRTEILGDLDGFRTRVTDDAGKLQSEMLERINKARRETLGQAELLLHDVLHQIATVKEQAEAATETMRHELSKEMTMKATRVRDDVIAELKPRIIDAASDVTGALAKAEHVAVQVESASGQLSALVRQVTDAQSTTSVMLRLVKSSNTSVEGLLSSLEPWRGALLGSGAGEVPEPIRRIIDSVRGELRQDLGGIAAALRTAAINAERAASVVDMTGERELATAATSTRAIQTANGRHQTEASGVGLDGGGV